MPRRYLGGTHASMQSGLGAGAGPLILFSSIATLSPAPGQASYAAANACLDADAVSHRSIGRASRSVQWPMVGGAGMGADGFAAVSRRGLSMVGLAGIDLEQYAACLSAQLSSGQGIGMSVQLVHHSALRSLLADLSEAAQPRFGELASIEAGGRASSALEVGIEGLFDTLAHSELIVLRLVRELSMMGESSELGFAEDSEGK